MTRIFCLMLMFLFMNTVAWGMEPVRKHTKLLTQSRLSGIHSSGIIPRLVAAPLVHATSSKTESKHSLGGKQNPVVVSKAKKINPKIVHIRTTDKYEIIFLKDFVDESLLLSRMIYQAKDKGYTISVKMTREEFNVIMPYLKIGAVVTQKQRDIGCVKNQDVLHKLQEELASARERLHCVVSNYSKKEWKHCLKTATMFRIDSVRQVAVAVGRERNWLQKPSDSDSIEKKRVDFMNSNF